MTEHRDTPQPLPSWLTVSATGADAGVRIAVKVVPGASRTSVVGVLGDRLKLRIAQPPANGRANAEVCALLADQAGMRPNSASVVAGSSAAQKTVLIRCEDPPMVAAVLARALRG